MSEHPDHPSSYDATTELPREMRDTRRPGGRHPVDVGHLVMGVALLGLTVVWLLVTTDVVDLGERHWLLPLPWLVAGAVGLAATAVRSTRAHGGHGRRHGHGSSHGGRAAWDRWSQEVSRGWAEAADGIRAAHRWGHAPRPGDPGDPGATGTTDDRQSPGDADRP